MGRGWWKEALASLCLAVVLAGVLTISVVQHRSSAPRASQAEAATTTLSSPEPTSTLAPITSTPPSSSPAPSSPPSSLPAPSTPTANGAGISAPPQVAPQPGSTYCASPVTHIYEQAMHVDDPNYDSDPSLPDAQPGNNMGFTGYLDLAGGCAVPALTGEFTILDPSGQPVSWWSGASHAYAAVQVPSGGMAEIPWYAFAVWMCPFPYTTPTQIPVATLAPGTLPPAQPTPTPLPSSCVTAPLGSYSVVFTVTSASGAVLGTATTPIEVS